MPRRGRRSPVSAWAGIVAVALALVAAASGSSVAPGENGETAKAPAGRAVAASAVPTLVAAGDISPPWLGTQRATSNLVLRLAPTRVLTLGDQQYDSGRLADYRAFYGPTWGRFKTKTSPTPGNHEYYTPGAAGYFSYFGPAAGRPGRGYYSFDLGGWHIVSLNSNIARGSRSPQERWLRANLAAASKRCVLAYWHHPRFSSGATYGNNATVAAFWSDLYAARADLVLNGHEHLYERFGPQTPAAVGDPRGIREFVVGTGGAPTYPFGLVKANSQRRITGRYGVLRLTLHRSSYEWDFIAADGRVLDRYGPVACH